jgi:hypothetical protein
MEGYPSASFLLDGGLQSRHLSLHSISPSIPLPLLHSISPYSQPQCQTDALIVSHNVIVSRNVSCLALHAFLSARSPPVEPGAGTLVIPRPHHSQNTMIHPARLRLCTDRLSMYLLTLQGLICHRMSVLLSKGGTSRFVSRTLTSFRPGRGHSHSLSMRALGGRPAICYLSSIALVRQLPNRNIPHPQLGPGEMGA